MFIRFLFFVLIYLSFLVSVEAAQCSATFSDGLTNSHINGKIKFKNSPQLLNNLGAILTTTEVDNQNTSLSCETVNCSASGGIAEPLSGQYTSYSSSSDLLVNGGTQIITANDYKDVEVKSGGHLIMSNSFTSYSFKKLKLKETSKISLTAGDYYFEEIELKSQSQLVVIGSGYVRIFVKKKAKFKESAVVNGGMLGDPLKLVIYFFADNEDKLKVESNATFAGYIYSENKVEIKGGNSKVLGAISAIGELKLKDGSKVTAANLEPDFGDLCSGTSSAILVSDWRMDEGTWQGSVDELRDSSGNNYHGNAASASTSTGFICNAADLSATGTDDYLSLDYSAINGLNNFSLSAWVKTSRTAAQTIMSVANSSQSNETVFFYENNTTSWPTIRESPFNTSTKYTVTNISTDTWKHHVWTRKTSANNGELCLYIDTALQGCSTHSNGEFAIDADATGFILGQEQDSLGGEFDSSQAFSGLLDEVLLFDGVLSTTEINDIYTNQNAGNNYDGTERSCGPPEPIAEWRMDEQAWSGITGEVLSEVNTLHGTAFGGLSTDRINPARSGNPGTCGYGDFDGIDDYVEIANESAFDLSEQLTVSAWIRPQTLPSSDLMSIVSKDGNYEFHLTPGGEVNWWWSLSNFSTSGANIIAGNWYHIAITYKDDYQFIYVNGIKRGESTHSGQLLLNNKPLQIGQDQFHNGRYFHGSIDEVRVYDGALSAEEVLNVYNETHPCASFIDHFQIDTKDQQGITCQADEIIIKACANSTCDTITPDAVDVKLLINNVEYKTVTVSGVLGTSTSYPYTTVGNAALSLDQTYKCTNTLGTTPCNVVFSDSGFIFSNIPTQISGKPSDVGFDATTLTIQAVETNDDNGACVGSFPDGGDVPINLSYSCDDGFCTEALTFSNNSNSHSVSQIAASYPLHFGANSITTFAISYPDAGKLFLNAEASVKVKDAAGNDVLDGNGDPIFKNLVGSSEPFVERPFGFFINAVDNPKATDASGATYKKAGEDFTVELSAVVWQSADDLDNDGVPDLGSDLFGNDVTEGFGRESSPETAIIDRGLVAPLSGTLGELVSTEFIFTNGIASDSGISYSEVGIINLTANLSGNSYLETSDVRGNEPFVGRFYPDHFVQTITLGDKGQIVANHAPTCSILDWVYTGQITDSEGSIKYEIEPILTITANNGDDVKTLNYIDDFAKLAYLNTDVKNKITFSPPLTKHTNLLPLQADVSGIGTITVQSGGLLTYKLPSEHHYVYTRNSASKVAPFKANFELPFDEFKDSDDVTFKTSSGSINYFQNPHFYQLDAIPPDVTAFDNTVEVRFGRWLLENSYGPETSNLPVTMFTQYFDGTGSIDFINNDKESCLIPTVGIKDPLGDIGDAGMVLWNYRLADLDSDDALLPADTDASVEDVNKTFVSGIYRWLLFSAPENNKQGSLEVEYQVPPWLQYDWNDDDNFTNNPTATLTFGIYRGNDRIIYQREIAK